MKKRIVQFPEFTKWLGSLDSTTKARLTARLSKVERGLMGDVEPVGDGVSEMREHFGAGWRMYFVERKQTIVVMLGGGSKRTQSKDIKAAKARAKELED
ncbi:MAG: type II toxin-antitoxin system RelE/ParE family toxin [Pseudomonadota bacterium]